MNTHADKTQDNNNLMAANDVSRQQSSKTAFQFMDNRPETLAQRKLQKMANKSPKAKQTVQMQAIVGKHFAWQKHPIQEKNENHSPQLNQLIQRKTNNNTTLQRLKKHFPTRADDDPLVAGYRDAVNQVVSEIENRVNQARGVAINWNQLNFDDIGYIGRWARTARDYFNNPKQVPDFIHARFGYAIETIACANLSGQHAGLSINFQVSVGHTRPDIVLFHPHDGVVAWLDITSLDSANHIQSKDGAGWRNKPFVYEVFYQPLNLSDILTGLEDPVFKAWGKYLSIKNQIVHEEREEKRTALRNQLLKLQEDEGWQTGIGNAATKRNLTKELLTTLGMELGHQSQKATRGALAITDINDGPFGFNTGDIGVDSNKTKKFINDQAAPAIEERQGIVEQNYLEYYQDIVADHQNLPLVTAFYQYLLNGINSDKIEMGTAVAASVQEHDRLDEARTSLSENKDERAINLNHEINQHIEALPDVVNFQALQTWSNQSAVLRNQIGFLEAVIEEQQLFLHYLELKYGGKTQSFFNQHPRERQLVQILSNTPITLTDVQEIVLATRQYREQNPLDG